MTNAREVIAAAMRGIQDLGDDTIGSTTNTEHGGIEMTLDEHGIHLPPTKQQRLLELAWYAQYTLYVLCALTIVFVVSFLWSAYKRRQGVTPPPVPLDYKNQKRLLREAQSKMQAAGSS